MQTIIDNFLSFFYSPGGARWHRRRWPEAKRKLEHVDKPEAKEKNEGFLFLLIYAKTC
jgi:hypothetical protein